MVLSARNMPSINSLLQQQSAADGRLQLLYRSLLRLHITYGALAALPPGVLHNHIIIYQHNWCH